MDERTSKTNSSAQKRRRTKRVSDGGEPIIVVPLVVEPVQVEVTLVIVLPEFRDVSVAIAVLPDRLYELSSVPLPLEYS